MFFNIPFFTLIHPVFKNRLPWLSNFVFLEPYSKLGEVARLILSGFRIPSSDIQAYLFVSQRQGSLKVVQGFSCSLVFILLLTATLRLSLYLDSYLCISLMLTPDRNWLSRMIIWQGTIPLLEKKVTEFMIVREDQLSMSDFSWRPVWGWFISCPFFSFSFPGPSAVGAGVFFRDWKWWRVVYLFH